MPDNSRSSDESPRDAAKLGGNERAGHDLIGDRTAPKGETRESNEPAERVEKDAGESTERVTRTSRDASSGSSGSATRSNRSVPASEIPGNSSETNPTGEASPGTEPEPGTGLPFPVGTGTGSGKIRSPLGPGGCAKPAATMLMVSAAAVSFVIRKSRIY